MALSAAERKRQQEAAARAAKNKKDAEARAAKLRAQTQSRIRAEANKKANDEKARLTSRADVQRAWGGGKAVDAKLKNDLKYVESQRVKKQDAVTAAQKNKPAPKPAAKPAPKPAAPPAPAVQPPAPPRSPAIGAPVHARPQAFGSATQVRGGVLSGAPAPSVYAPQAGAAPKPNAPVAAAKEQPMSPQYGGNDEPGRLGQNEGGYQMPPQAQPQQPAGGPDANGIDMERRRAFLDAEDSLSGLKAVKELLNRRKLSISVEN